MGASELKLIARYPEWHVYEEGRHTSHVIWNGWKCEIKIGYEYSKEKWEACVTRYALS